MLYVKRKRLKALKDDLDRCVDKYQWTGNGKVIVKLSDPNQELIELKRRETWKVFEIKFPRTLKKDEEVTVEMVFELEDVKKESVPVLSSTITEPTKFLRMKVVFPDAVGVDPVIVKSVLSGLAARKPLESSTDRITFSEYIWDIPDPEISKCYMLQWTWLD